MADMAHVLWAANQGCLGFHPWAFRAANPADTDYFYYVLSAEDGSHTFSETLEEHNEAVRKAREDGVLP